MSSVHTPAVFDYIVDPAELAECKRQWEEWADTTDTQSTMGWLRWQHAWMRAAEYCRSGPR